jgi:hypothetical protein
MKIENFVLRQARGRGEVCMFKLGVIVNVVRNSLVCALRHAVAAILHCADLIHLTFCSKKRLNINVHKK